MIRIMTLDGALSNGQSPEALRARIEPQRRGGIDLLCCQSVRHAAHAPANADMDASAAASRRLSDALGLTCSCFAAGRRQGRSAGLAILTGTGVWMLNSGSFAVGEGDEEAVVQFGLVRKNGASVLALNLHLADSPQAQARQLADLFAHSLLKDPYGAVALCADRPARISFKEWQALAALPAMRRNAPCFRTPNPACCACSPPGPARFPWSPFARNNHIPTATARNPQPRP